MPRSSCSKVKDTVPQVGRGEGMTNHHHDISTHKKMMHRFNKHCIEGRKEGSIIGLHGESINVLT